HVWRPVVGIMLAEDERLIGHELSKTDASLPHRRASAESLQHSPARRPDGAHATGPLWPFAAACPSL
ncbi:MAG: hypothetical protein ACXW39_07635, partial [Nitrospira sp.]